MVSKINNAPTLFNRAFEYFSLQQEKLSQIATQNLGGIWKASADIMKKHGYIAVDIWCVAGGFLIACSSSSYVSSSIVNAFFLNSSFASIVPTLYLGAVLSVSAIVGYKIFQIAKIFEGSLDTGKRDLVLITYPSSESTFSPFRIKSFFNYINPLYQKLDIQAVRVDKVFKFEKLLNSSQERRTPIIIIQGHGGAQSGIWFDTQEVLDEETLLKMPFEKLPPNCSVIFLSCSTAWLARKAKQKFPHLTFHAPTEDSADFNIKLLGENRVEATFFSQNGKDISARY